MSRRVQCCSSFKHPKIANWPPWHGQLSSPSKELHSEQIGRKKGWAKAGSRFKKCRDIFKAKNTQQLTASNHAPNQVLRKYRQAEGFSERTRTCQEERKGIYWHIQVEIVWKHVFQSHIIYVYIYTSNTYTVMICYASKSPTVVVTICVVTFPSTVFRPPKVDGFGTLAHGVHAPEFFQIPARNQSQRD